MPEPSRDEYDWIETVVKVGGWIGLNPVRTRWKLRVWQDQLKREGGLLKVRQQALTREHRTCPSCGAIASADERVCARCRTKLPSRPVELASRVFRQFGFGFGPEILIGAVFILAYLLAVTRIRMPGFGFGVPAVVLVNLGGNDYALTAAGQWWRLWTCVFLHAGLWHLGFNTYALLQLAPLARREYGGYKTLAVFLLAGVGASAASLWWGLRTGMPGVSIGGSGALCGLVGLMAAWGHREKTGMGFHVRNYMLRWLVYILIFGWLVRADNAAHFGGLLIGTALGFGLAAKRGVDQGTGWKLLGWLSGLAVVAALAAIFYLGWVVPPLIPYEGF